MTTFNKNNVTLFIDRSYPYAAICFAKDHVKVGEEIKSTVVEKWFKKYFPSPRNHEFYRELETQCTQFTILK